MIRKERDPAKRGRLHAVALLLTRRVPRQEIKIRTGLPPATAYSYLHRFFKKGPQGLLDLKAPGRPKNVPEIIRERFAYLCRPDPYGAPHNVLYVIERERLVFKMLGHRFATRQIGRWYKLLAREHGASSRLRRFRTMRAAYHHLRSPERQLISSPTPRTPRDFKRILRIDALSYVSDRRTQDRELYRRLISAIHKIPLGKISFGGEPGLANADFAWNAKPEEREPADIFAPIPKCPLTQQIIEGWLKEGNLG